MLRLPAFEVSAPDSIEGVVQALQAPGAMILAGGTDLLPNLKHRLHAPERLVSLQNVRALKEVREDEEAIKIGAGVTLTEVSRHPLIGSLFPSLAKAAGLVASPLLRNMGTLGGNVNLDTRCRYVNQTAFWRKALGGGCLKSEGSVCHVVPQGQSCVAALSSDCVPVLITLDAKITLVGPEGTRVVALDQYYSTDGVSHTLRKPGEVMTDVIVPRPTGTRRTGYVKWTVRKSIDFPLLSVALRFDVSGKDDLIEESRVCFGVLAARPKLAKLDVLKGKPLFQSTTLDKLCAEVHKQGKPLDNVPYEADYRRKMIPIYVRRELERMKAIIAAGPAASPTKG
jgi:4-hydroxybenzoyl-CoA reductase subunit beta